jgi:hypothetical protein
MGPRSGTARQSLTAALFVLSLLFLGGGLVFLCAATQSAGRFPVALALLVIGGALAAWSGARWHRARMLSPEVVKGRITELAAAGGGELTLAQAISALNVPEESARAALADLESAGLCYEDRREGRTVLVFPGLQESQVVRRCTYCGNHFSVREPLHKCPHCGGDLQIVKK